MEDLLSSLAILEDKVQKYELGKHGSPYTPTVLTLRVIVMKKHMKGGEMAGGLKKSGE